MNTINLQNLINVGKLEKFQYQPVEVIKKMNNISNRVNTAEKLLKNNNDDENIDITAYSELYSSYRGICEALLWHYGYKIKSIGGHHELAKSTISLTLNSDKNKPVYSRMRKISNRRNELEYGNNFNISRIELETMLVDVKNIFDQVYKLIKNKK